MRILFIQSTLERGGITSQLISLIPELLKSGHQPEILTISAEPTDSEEKVFEGMGVTIHKLSTKRWWPNFAVGIFLKRKLKEIKPDIIQTSTLRPTVFSSKFCYGYKRVGVLQSDIFANYSDTYGSFIGSAFAKAELKAFNILEGQVVVSKFLQEKFAPNLHNIPSIIPNGIPTPNFVDYPKPNLENGTPNFLVAGLLIQRKNPELIAEAFLKSKWCKIAQLKFAGKGELLDSLKEKYKNFNQIQFCGQLNSDEIAKERSMASLFISASHSEGLPFSVIEALAWKTPCLLSDIPPHVELASMNDRGIMLFKCDSEGDLVEKLNSFEPGVNKIDFRFPSAEHMAQSYLNLYHNLLNKD